MAPVLSRKAHFLLALWHEWRGCVWAGEQHICGVRGDGWVKRAEQLMHWHFDLAREHKRAVWPQEPKSIEEIMQRLKR